jgi:glycosyltransferase involved in cell wall biosynthesis
MKVVMIHGNPIAPDPRIIKEAKSLAKSGYDIKILAWDRIGIYDKTEKNDFYTIFRFTYKAPSGTLKVIFNLPRWWSYVFVWLMRTDWDIVHSNDFVTFPPSLLAAKLKRNKIIYDIYDFYADNLPATAPRVFRLLISYIDKTLMRYADGIIIADESRHSQIGDNAKRAIVVTNSPEDTISENSTNKNLNQSPKEGEFLIFYAGQLARERGLTNMIKAVENIEDVNIVIAGFGKDEIELKNMFNKHKNVTFVGRISQESAFEWTLRSDLLFALYDTKIRNNKYSSPNKLFEAMMFGKPIIVNRGTTMAEIVNDNKCGVVVDYDDIDEIRRTVLELKQDRILRDQLGYNGKVTYKEKYDWAIMETRLLNLYHNI